MIIRKVYNNLKRTMLLLLWLACSHAVLAQERVVTGSVKDASGEGLAGVSVVVKGSTLGANTDMEGRFSISVGSDATLMFSFIGYLTREIVVSGSTLNVTLSEDAAQLDEVVVSPENQKKFLEMQNEEFKKFEYETDQTTEVVNIANDKITRGIMTDGINFVNIFKALVNTKKDETAEDKKPLKVGLSQQGRLRI